MKKSLLALAILGSFAGAASAQTSNVTVYGIMDLSLSHYNGNGNPYSKTGGSWTGIEEGNDGNAHNGSRIGFKGTEDLGGGLSAIFKMEGGFAADTGKSTQGGRLFGRQSWVGLSSKSVGTVTFGRQDGLLFDDLDIVDPFDQGFVGNILGAVGKGFGIGGQSRVDNSVVYRTVDYAGFSAAVQYGFGEQANAFGKNSYFGATANYANGPIAAYIGYAKSRDLAFDSNGDGTNDSAYGYLKAYSVGGTYDFGVAKVAAAFDNEKDNAGLTNKNSYMLGVTVPFGVVTGFASWVHAKEKETNDKSDQLALGAQYDLSKRTNLYAAAAWGKAKPASGDSKSTTGFQVGIDHAF
jgi:predicted porin